MSSFQRCAHQGLPRTAESPLSKIMKSRLAQMMNESTLQLLEVVGQLENICPTTSLRFNPVFVLFRRTQLSPCSAFLQATNR
jgi:hypothetical protein